MATNSHLSTQAVANRLVELIRERQFIQAQRELFAEEAVNQEPPTSVSKSATGLQAIIQKEERFQANVLTWHRVEVSEPLVAGNFFSVRMLTDVTLKDQRRFCLDELCVYEVTDGLIIREQFFY
ncbi:hypothetical protein GCM10027341_19860 [Spirosoma knui]